MGQEELPGYIEAGEDERTEGKGEGLEEDRAEDGQISLRKILDGTSTSSIQQLPIQQLI